MLKTSETVEKNSSNKNTKVNKYANRQKRIFDSFERFDGQRSEEHTSELQSH